MISRRNIRIKVMQILYSIDVMDDNSGKKDPIKSLNSLVEQTKELFTFLLYFTLDIARYAEVDAQNRAGKNIKTSEDLHVNIKIAGNTVLWSVLENKTYTEAIANLKVAQYEGLDDLIKKAYLKLVQSDEYQQYIQEESRIKKGETDILEYIFTELVLIDEDVLSFVESIFPSWDDDAEMLSTLLIGILHKPNSLNIAEMLPKETWDYARELLHTVLDKKEYLNDIIKPKLKNWEMDRIAMIDIVLLQMGLAELLYFDTIPPKVTINEYIDIAKEYSTDNSGHFVNGILDGMRKDLDAAGKINKVDFRKN